MSFFTASSTNSPKNNNTMSDIVNVTIVGHSSSGLNAIEQVLQDDAGIDLTRKLLLEGAADPFEDLPQTSNVMLLDLGDNWRDVLVSVASRSRRNKTPMIVIGPDGNTEMIKLALRAGARDFQTRPATSQELRLSIRKVENERSVNEKDISNVNMAVFISAKGGAGASSIVSCLGQALAQRKDDSNVMLMDLDLQYGSLPLYFDQSSNTKLTQALTSNERIDATLLDACIQRTDSGVDLLTSHSDQVFSAWEVPQNSVANMLNLVSDRYDHVLIDIPRQIDPVTFQAIEMSTHVCIVMQQTLSDLRQTRQIISLLKDQGLPNDRVKILINRHEKSNVLRAVDVSDAFDGLNVTTLTNDYKRVSYAVDNAIPLIKKYRSSRISKDIIALSETLFPKAKETRRGFFGRRG